MGRRTRILLVCASIGLLPFCGAMAQEKLPASMQGRWIGMGGQAGKIPIDFAWSIEITKQNPDGTLQGTMTFGGPQCKAKDAPMTGSFDGTTLTVSAELEPKMQCGKVTYQLKKAGGKHLFEVSLPNRSGYLDPK